MAEPVWGESFPLILSGPSGAGKSTIAQELVRHLPRAWLSVSATTRKPRAGESDGVDYRFLDRAQFEREREAGNFLEWAEVHGQYYGTPQEPMEEVRRRGELPILDIDVQGGVQVRSLLPMSVLVFLLPPSLAILEERLRNRGSDSEAEVAKRMHNALREMEFVDRYDYLVVNHDVERTIATITGIIRAENRRCSRLPRGRDWDPLLRRQDGLF